MISKEEENHLIINSKYKFMEGMPETKNEIMQATRKRKSSHEYKFWKQIYDKLPDFIPETQWNDVELKSNLHSYLEENGIAFTASTMDEHNQLRKFQDTNALQIRESVIPAALNVDLAKDLDTYKREEYKNSKICRTQLDEMIKSKYTYMRKIRGDGNCYYRAFYFRYLEILISKPPDFLFAFIKRIENQGGLFNVRNSYSKKLIMENFLPRLKSIFNTRISHLSAQLLAINESNIELLTSALYDVNFDLGGIRLMRGLTENFFRNYGDFQVGAEGHSLPLNVICMSEPTVTSYENYILKFVQPMEIEAQTAILYVLPMVLRINLRIIMLHNEMKGTFFETVYPSIAYGDYLDHQPSNNEEIQLFYRPGHYDIMYDNKNCIYGTFNTTIKQIISVIERKSEQAEKTKQVQLSKRSNLFYTPCCGIAFGMEQYLGMLNEKYKKGLFSWSWSRRKIKKINCPLCRRQRDIKEYLEKLTPKYRAELLVLFPKYNSYMGNMMNQAEKDNSNYNCNICLMKIGNKPSIMLKSCSHNFHAECIAKRKTNNCPYCHLQLLDIDKQNMKKELNKIFDNNYSPYKEQQAGKELRGDKKGNINTRDKKCLRGCRDVKEEIGEFTSEYFQISETLAEQKYTITRPEVKCPCGESSIVNQYRKCKCYPYCEKCFSNYCLNLSKDPTFSKFNVICPSCGMAVLDLYFTKRLQFKLQTIIPSTSALSDFMKLIGQIFNQKNKKCRKCNTISLDIRNKNYLICPKCMYLLQK